MTAVSANSVQSGGRYVCWLVAATWASSVVCGGCIDTPQIRGSSGLGTAAVRNSMVLDYAMTGCSEPVDDVVREDTAGMAAYLRTLVVKSGSYVAIRDAVLVPHAGRLDSFVMLIYGGCERSKAIVAFEHEGQVYCFTSAETAGVREHAHLWGKTLAESRENLWAGEAFRAALPTRVLLNPARYRRSMDDLRKHAKKGDAIIDISGRYQSGVWMHIVAYSNRERWFLRATAVDVKAAGAIWSMIEWDAFAVAKEKSIRTYEERVRGTNAPGAMPDAECETNAELEEYAEIFNQKWEECLPFLAAFDFVWGGEPVK